MSRFLLKFTVKRQIVIGTVAEDQEIVSLDISAEKLYFEEKTRGYFSRPASGLRAFIVESFSCSVARDLKGNHFVS
jgi:hypothetical protein